MLTKKNNLSFFSMSLIFNFNQEVGMKNTVTRPVNIKQTEDI